VPAGAVKIKLPFSDASPKTVPILPPNTGVTDTVEVAAVAAAFVAVKEGIVAEPDAANPIVVFELVQLKFVPVVAPVGTTAVVEEPAQTVWLEIAVTVGVGFTVIVNVVAGELVQPLLVPVTEIVAVTGADPVFTAVKAGILPVPEAAKPTDVVLFVQA
jgi:hypothetical protein